MLSQKCVRDCEVPSSCRARRISLVTYVIRISIVLGMILSAATFLHICNYIPEQTFLSCDRPCHHLDWPMICRVKLTLEVFQSLSKSCGDCPTNETACLADHCVSADGFRRGILTANRQLPGPSIQVCENDILVVDVVNRLPGKTAAIHWRGQSQSETPCMDGVPLITQCPIPSYTIFQYKFRAAIPGTHLWHAHSDSDVTNGIFGSLIVRQADLLEPHRSLYDIDDPNHVVLVSAWYRTIVSEGTVNEVRRKPSSLLINGRGREAEGPAVPLTEFTVIPGKRHRFRIAHAGGSCPIKFTVQEHPLVLIALDGHPVAAQDVSSIILSKGERADVILRANKPISKYLMSFRTSSDCSAIPVTGSAILNYKANVKIDIGVNKQLSRNDELTAEKFGKKIHMTTNPVEKCGTSGSVCVTEVKALEPLMAPLNNPRTDVTMYLPINQRTLSTDLMGNGEANTRVLSVDNATFTYPSSPLLTQRADVPENVYCSPELFGTEGKSSMSRCKRPEAMEKFDSIAPCECVHVRRIPLASTVEIVLFDQAGLDDLVYHLHGYSFHVVGARKFGNGRSLRDITEMNDRGVLFARNLERPPLKDTVVVPKFGAVALRFKADNPGYWILRDEHASEWTRGLDVVLQVGEAGDMMPFPQDFPKCGSFVGPEYFLI